VVFDKGPVFDALRSTMSLPAIFAPWRVGDNLLVDGGILNNVPVDQVRKRVPTLRSPSDWRPPSPTRM
jgi:NTE family protein